jgi:hypothetical protein
VVKKIVRSGLEYKLEQMLFVWILYFFNAEGIATETFSAHVLRSGNLFEASIFIVFADGKELDFVLEVLYEGGRFKISE